MLRDAYEYVKTDITDTISNISSMSKKPKENIIQLTKIIIFPVALLNFIISLILYIANNGMNSELKFDILSSYFNHIINVVFIILVLLSLVALFIEYFLEGGKKKILILPALSVLCLGVAALFILKHNKDGIIIMTIFSLLFFISSFFIIRKKLWISMDDVFIRFAVVFIILPIIELVLVNIGPLLIYTILFIVTIFFLFRGGSNSNVKETKKYEQKEEPKKERKVEKEDTFKPKVMSFSESTKFSREDNGLGLTRPAKYIKFSNFYNPDGFVCSQSEFDEGKVIIKRGNQIVKKIY